MPCKQSLRQLSVTAHPQRYPRDAATA